MLDIWYSLGPPRVPPCLGPDELQRQQRLRGEAARRAWGQAHSLKRHVLSHYAPGHAPAGWAFVHTTHGKPELAPCCARAFPYRFNLSHGGSSVAVAVARGEVGVDIECHRPLAAAGLLVERVFGPAEQRWLHGQPGFEAAFFRLWTLKEALLKAIGAGFTCPPRTLCWDGLDHPDAATVWFNGRRWVGLSRCFGAVSLAAVVRGDDRPAATRWLNVTNGVTNGVTDGMTHRAGRARYPEV